MEQPTAKSSRPTLRKVLCALTLALILSAGMALAFALTLPDNSIKIALAGPASGPLAQYGQIQNTAAQLAIEDINNAGGINGQQLKAVIYDDACDPKQAISVAKKIANDNIQFVVGHVCSGATQAASKIYEAEGILMITSSASRPANYQTAVMT